MDKSDYFMFGACLGSILMCLATLAILHNSPEHELYETAKKHIQECEAELPRNQTCQIILTAKVFKGSAE